MGNAKKKTKVLSVEESTLEFAEHLVSVVARALTDEEEGRGYDHSDNLGQAILAGLTSMIVARTLDRKPLGVTRSDEMYEFVATNYSNVKLGIENAIALGVGGALASYSGKEVEYYCQIKVVPEPTNILPC